MGARHVIPEFILRAHRRENPFAIYGGGETRAFCHVDDAIRATHLVAIKPNTDQEIVHIGNSAEEITINALAEMIMSLMNVRLPLAERGRRPGSVARRCPDLTKLQRLTDFEAAVSLRQGLPGTIEWYVARSA
jgi:UDP-glucose 4-epimerase/UDP-glucuronate decarboxylase